MRKLTQVLLEFAKASGSASGLEISLVRVDEILLRLPADLVEEGLATPGLHVARDARGQAVGSIPGQGRP